MDCKEAVRSVAPVPPSVQTVFCTLYGHDPMTGSELRDLTGLPRRTVYAALQRLKELGLLRERASLRDARQTYFWVASGEQQAPQQKAPKPAPPSGLPAAAADRDAGLPSWARPAGASSASA